MSEFYNLYGGAMIDSVTQPPITNVGVGAATGAIQPQPQAQAQPPVAVNGTVQQPTNAKKNNNKPTGNNASGNKPAKNNAKNAKNNAKNNANNANNANNNANNENNNNLSNEVKERIANIKLNPNKTVISFWIIWLISVILLLSTFITTPIRYSEAKVIHKVTYNRFYYYLHVVLLALLCFYAYKIGDKMPLVKSEDIYQKIAPIAVFVLGFMVLNIYDSPSIKEDGSFSSAPSVLIKNKIGMIVHYVFMILSIITIIGLYLYYSSDSLLGYQTSYLITATPAILVFIVCLFLLYLTARYRVKKYNLPNTWRK